MPQWLQAQVTVGSKFKVEGLCYKVIGAESLEVVPQKDIPPYWDNNEKPNGKIDIPATVEYETKTYSVPSIGANAFSNCIGLTEISLPESIAKIARAIGWPKW